MRPRVCALLSLCSCLRDSEAEGSGHGVGPLSILQHQPPVLSQRQVVTSGQVAQSERLAPTNVAPAPAVKVTTDIQYYIGANMQTYKEKMLYFISPGA